MTTKGIEGHLIETHNWRKIVAFWKSLGYEVELETDHPSSKLRHLASFEPPTSGKAKRPFIKEHWGVLQMLVADPDGREIAIEASLKESAG
jgi:hypothetical protein